MDPNWIGIPLFILALVFVFYILSGHRSIYDKSTPELNAEETQLVGYLTGLLGGSISDAAVARFALQRFQEEQGRKATMADAALVVAMIQGMK